MNSFHFESTSSGTLDGINVFKESCVDWLRAPLRQYIIYFSGEKQVYLDFARFGNMKIENENRFDTKLRQKC